MEELVSPQQAQAIVRSAAAALVALGVVIAAAGAARRERRQAAVAVGALTALAGALLYALWAAFNGVIAKFGLDSVKGLLINLAIFALAGIGYGLVAGSAWQWARRRAARCG